MPKIVKTQVGNLPLFVAEEWVSAPEWSLRNGGWILGSRAKMRTMEVERSGSLAWLEGSEAEAYLRFSLS